MDENQKQPDQSADTNQTAGNENAEQPVEQTQQNTDQAQNSTQAQNSETTVEQSTPDASAQENQPAVSSPSEEPQAPAKKAKKFPVWLLSLVATLVLIVIGLGTLAYLQTEDVSNNAEQDEVAYEPVESLTVGLITVDGYKLYPEIERTSTEFYINQQIYEGLVAYEDTTKITPRLAESWTNPDDKTWDFKLKTDVQFHNGQDMTAQHVADSIERLRKNKEMSEIFLATIKDVEVIDEQNVRITTTEPDPVLLNKLAYVSIIDSNDEDAEIIPGTGPYTLKEGGTNDGKSELELTAFDNYHRGVVEGVQNLTFRIYTGEQEALQAYNDAEVDLLQQIIDEDDLKQVTRQYETGTYNDLGVNYMGLNMVMDSPLQDKDVRKAVYHAIDVQKVIDETNTTANVASQIVTNNITGFDPSIQRLEYSPETARELLAEAGYEDGVELELTYFVAVDDVATNIAEQLEEVGFDITLDKHTEGATIGAKVFGGNAEMWYGGYSSDTNDLTDVVAALFVDTPYYTNETVNEQYEEVTGEVNISQRIQKLQQISRTVADDVAYVPMFNRASFYIVDDPSLVLERAYPGNDLGVNFAEVQRQVTN